MEPTFELKFLSFRRADSFDNNVIHFIFPYVNAIYVSLLFLKID